MIQGRATNKVLIDVFQDYKKHRSLKLKTITTYDHVLRHGLGDWLYLPMNQINGKMVYDRHAELSAKAPHLADLTFRVLRAIFKWASAYYEDENGEALITKNPVDKITGIPVSLIAFSRESSVRQAEATFNTGTFNSAKKLTEGVSQGDANQSILSSAAKSEINEYSCLPNSTFFL